MEKIGEYHSQLSHLDLTLGRSVRWVGKTPPKDRTLIYIEHSQVNLTIYIVSASASVVGVIIAFVFLAFNIKYRNQRYIKMSSPHLNNLIIVGCMLTYLSVIFLGLDTTLSSVAAFPYICTARAWILMAGFSLAFGAMFSKTWRVHSIFTDLKLNKKVIKDYQLFMVVGVLIFLDIAIITTWQVADPFYRDTKQLEARHHESMDDVLVIPENEYCQSEHMTIFVSIIYAYKGLLLVFGAFLAWETRHVSIPALNDSKHIGFSVYNVFITCIAGAAISLVLSDRKDLVFVLLSFFIIFCTTATLCLVFVPKLVEMKRNPQGVVDKRVRATLRPMSKNRRDSSVCELEQRLRDVKNTNCRFRKVLMEKENELQALIRKLGPEARKWIDGITCTGSANGETDSILNDMTRLSARPVRREMPSTTEITELTSVDSVTSTHGDMDNSMTSVQSTTIAPTLPPKKRSLNVNSTTENQNSNNAIKSRTPIQEPPQGLQQHQLEQLMKISETITLGQEQLSEKRTSASAQTDCSTIMDKANEMQCNIIREKLSQPERRMSAVAKEIRQNGNMTPITKHKHNHRSSTANVITTTNADLNNACPHAKNMGSNMRISTIAKLPTTSENRQVSGLKSSFVVSQSDLWDTQTLSHSKQYSRSSPRNHSSIQRCAEHGHIIAYDQTTSPIQRSVSEKNRNKHRHKLQKGTVCQSETDSEREPTPTNIQCHGQQQQQQKQQKHQQQQQQRKLNKVLVTGNSIQQAAHHHSSPNVAPDKQRNTNHSSICGASSESELLDGETAILPIFRKLLTEKSPHYRGRSVVVGQSCPNISIKCDIVEYL